ncbi:hypothetical protein [Streptomyces sp. NBC_01353]|uniref:hypothetical protein n=1 Tax=Streptomyces sp. NBC_01353 TaxID=2903835 RepID=UPI002E31F318|nr:hypothetical protein [Streptomyces sp. NBC_01353]
MHLPTWTAVDDYFNGLLVEEVGPLLAAAAESDAAGLPPHQVAPNQGKLLHLIADLRNARTVLEIGTLGGYSTSVIIGDNAVRDGAATDAAGTDPRVQGVRRFTELIAAHPRLSATTVQTVGAKGYDGFTLALVTD